MNANFGFVSWLARAGLACAFFAAPAAFAIKDGMSPEDRAMLCSDRLVASRRSEFGGKPHVTVYRRDHGFTIYQRTDRGFRDGNGFAPLRQIIGDDLVNARFLRGKRVLDAGCGDGRFVRALRELGADAVGLDLELTPEQEREPKIFFKGDMLHSGLPDQSFDLIFSSYSLFYYEPLNFDLLHGVLRAFERLLVAGGRVVLAGNPAEMVGVGALDPREAYLRAGWGGRNDYLERLLPGDSSLRVLDANGRRVVLRKGSGWRRLLRLGF